jgi:uncharacterized RDD family membrane protein YckC
MSNYGSQFPAGDGFQENPYLPTGTGYGIPQTSNPVGTLPLASLSKRFFGAVLDTLLPSLFVFPGYVMVIAGVIMADQQSRAGGEPGSEFPVIALLGFGLIAVGFLVTLVVQIFLLATRSQTLGKFIMQTQIVDFDTGQPADFVHCAILRILVNSIICSIPCAGAIYSLVDIFYIFRDDRRCIHDLLASTTVVDIRNR